MSQIYTNTGNLWGKPLSVTKTSSSQISGELNTGTTNANLPAGTSSGDIGLTLTNYNPPPSELHIEYLPQPGTQTNTDVSDETLAVTETAIEEKDGDPIIGEISTQENSITKSTSDLRIGTILEAPALVRLGMMRNRHDNTITITKELLSNALKPGNRGNFRQLWDVAKRNDFLVDLIKLGMISFKNLSPAQVRDCQGLGITQVIRTINTKKGSVSHVGTLYQIKIEDNLIRGQTLDTNPVRKFTIDLDRLLSTVEEENRAGLRSTILNLPGEVLEDLSIEADTLDHAFDTDTIVKKYTLGTYDPDMDLIGTHSDLYALVHEIFHALDFIYSDFKNNNSSMGGGTTGIGNDFFSTFEEEMRDYINNGGKKRERQYDKENDHFTYLNFKKDNYCTLDESEMFAECCTLIVLGDCDSAKTILKHFSKTLVQAKELMIALRSLSSNIRSNQSRLREREIQKLVRDGHMDEALSRAKKLSMGTQFIEQVEAAVNTIPILRELAYRNPPTTLTSEDYQTINLWRESLEWINNDLFLALHDTLRTQGQPQYPPESPDQNVENYGEIDNVAFYDIKKIDDNRTLLCIQGTDKDGYQRAYFWINNEAVNMSVYRQ